MLTLKQAHRYADRIAIECSQCFRSVKATKRWGKWEIDINGGSPACYGRTVRDIEGAKWTLDTVKND